MDDRFIRLRLGFCKQLFTDYVPDVINALKDQAISGNVRAAEIFLTWLDEYRKENPGNIEPELEANEQEITAVLIKIRQKKI